MTPSHPHRNPSTNKPSNILKVLLCGLLLSLGLVVFHAGAAPGAAAGIWTAIQPDPDGEIQAAWKRLQQAEKYAVSTDVEQTIHPLASIQTVGQRSKQQFLHMSGVVNRAEETMEMNLWSQGGSVLDPDSSAAIKVEGERAYASTSSGEWQEIQNFTELFAPGGDFSVFLGSVKNARAVAGSQADKAAGLVRYAFDVDGTALADLLHDEMKRQMVEGGGLPPGIEIAVPAAYRDMTGSGEVWIDEAGYPVRQKILLVFPPRELEAVSPRGSLAVTRMSSWRACMATPRNVRVEGSKTSQSGSGSPPCRVAVYESVSPSGSMKLPAGRVN